MMDRIKSLIASGCDRLESNRSGYQVITSLLVPRCALCDTVHSSPNRLCDSCIASLKRHHRQTPSSSDAIVARDSLAHPSADGFPRTRHQSPSTPFIPDVRRLESAFNYQGKVTDLITHWKYKGMLELTPIIARWMSASSAVQAQSYDFVAPIPTHWRRRLTRGFDHTWLLTNALAREGVTVTPTPLLQHRTSLPYQHLKSRHERYIDTAHFRVLRCLNKNRILLIDDVVTTGTTLSAAAAALTRAGAATVDALTVATAASSPSYCSGLERGNKAYKHQRQNEFFASSD
ncbi:phosphoribosyltransferase family protein [Luminiphilus sp.]|nr:phosphoribosyltransferase family protein [Luminiphilus sp.]MDA8947152.1 phosphoribosyltransferase family protein [Luminiphilus sp.]MDB2316801.1 phosphoribosyltransferase family protein [Luminiphilus sp.]MDB2378746.1 phosphoribosyltransferase family protein [Luminiphilus sp.]MDB2380734.1 phosphoribosyltransferase family protein [Luminiphilus sp.]